VLHQRASRLSREDLIELTARIAALLPRAWMMPRGRPRALTLLQAVEATVIYLRGNHVQETVGEFHDVSQSTISRAISVLTALVRAATAAHIPDDAQIAAAVADRIVLVDGTLAPVWSWNGHRRLYSGKHRRTGFNLQVVTDAHGRLITVRGPIEGCAHDLRALRETGLPALLVGAGYVFADLGYRGTGYFVPRRKPVGGQLADRQRDDNARFSAIRAWIERAVANLKTWRILHTDYRRPLHTYNNALHAVLGPHWLTTTQRSA
jgi:hypothetical protein